MKVLYNGVPVPEWLHHLRVGLFQDVTMDKSEVWDREFVNAVKRCVSLEDVKANFLIVILQECVQNFDHVAFPESIKCLQEAIALWGRKDIMSVDWIKRAKIISQLAGDACVYADSKIKDLGMLASCASNAARAARFAAGATEEENEFVVFAAEESLSLSTMKSLGVIGRDASAEEWSREQSIHIDYFADQILRLLRNC